jgi:hypothetical protein
MKPNTVTVATELYATEAAESRKQAQADVSAPDPRPEDGQKAIEEAIANESK